MAHRYLHRVTSVLLLGRDHAAYDEATVVSVTTDLAAAMSVGADRRSPSLAFKADPDCPNEDALCAVVDGDRTMLAVADAHYGPESSHALIAGLHRHAAGRAPGDEAALHELLGRLDEPPVTESETAFVVAVHDRASGRLFGVSVGDASIWIVNSGVATGPVNDHTRSYVTSSWDDHASLPFDLRVEAGDTVLMFTDGIDECHYRRPATSIRPDHAARVVTNAEGDPARIAADLTQLALDGVDGHPGGQDNIALLVLRG